MSARPDDPRKTALALLRAVLVQRRPLDDALSDHKDFAALDRRDRAFARHLVSTSLRRLGQIDALIDPCLDRPLKAKHAPVRDVLRLGVCQIAFLKTPAHAAVDGSVKLVQGRMAPYRGLVNAVLRRFDEARPALRAMVLANFRIAPSPQLRCQVAIRKLVAASAHDDLRAAGGLLLLPDHPAETRFTVRHGAEQTIARLDIIARQEVLAADNEKRDNKNIGHVGLHLIGLSSLRIACPDVRDCGETHTRGRPPPSRRSATDMNGMPPGRSIFVDMRPA